MTFEKPFFDGENTAVSANKKKAVKEPQTLTAPAPAAPSKKIAGTTHRKKRLEDTELALEDVGGKKPRPVISRDHTPNPEDSSYDTTTHGVIA